MYQNGWRKLPQIEWVKMRSENGWGIFKYTDSTGLIYVDSLMTCRRHRERGNVFYT